MGIEYIGIIIGALMGLFGAVFSLVQFFYQRHKDKEQAAREALRDREQEERQALQDLRYKEQVLREQEQALREKELEEKQDIKDRLAFLTQVIIDKDIPRESRKPFFEEYIAKGGNGTVIKFWFKDEKGA